MCITITNNYFIKADSQIEAFEIFAYAMKFLTKMVISRTCQN